MVGADEPVDAIEGRQRAAARVAAHAALLQAQLDPAGTADELAGLVAEADRRRWPDVGIVARYAQDFLVRRGAGSAPAAGDGHAVDVMHRLAVDSGDPALLALVLAHRARARSSTGDPELGLLADADLAASVVLLEREAGGSLERVLAHVECAISFGHRLFWELERDQYEAALAIDPLAEEPALLAHPEVARFIRWAPLYNLVELETRWASAASIAGDRSAQRAHARAARRRLDDVAALPEPWPDDLAGIVLVARALEGEDVADAAAEAARRPGLGPDVAGTALTARAVALASRRPREAAEAAEAAIRLLDGVTDPTAVDLALWIAAETEGSSAGLRLGRVQAQRRWTERRLSRNAMEATLRSERLRVRSEELERHAHLDALTGLANRRGFSRYLDDLLASGTPRVAVLTVDVDRFKRVNDTRGHPAGDELLARLGGILGSLVRHSDLAARLGGDEFVLLLNGTGMEIAVERAAAILRAASTPDGPAELPFSVSIGVAAGDPADLDVLMADADRALYEAKSTGGGRAVAAPWRPPPGTAVD